MAMISSAAFYCGATNTLNSICDGRNTFTLTGSFSGAQGDGDIQLRPSLGTITSIQIDQQSATSIQGHFQYSRFTPRATALEDEPGSISVTVSGASGPPVHVAFPPLP